MTSAEVILEGVVDYFEATRLLADADSAGEWVEDELSAAGLSLHLEARGELRHRHGDKHGEHNCDREFHVDGSYQSPLSINK